MRRLFAGIAIAMIGTAVVQAGELPLICRNGAPPSSQKPVQDLSGQLPVPDYLDAILQCANEKRIGARQSERPRSPWLEADSRRYFELLSRQEYPWLVLPAQTQYYGFDRAERALIGAEVALALSDQGSMPDTLLVARALGEVRRRYDLADIDELTAAVAATRRVETFVGHDGQHQMTLTIQLLECAAGSTCRLLKRRDWRNLPFSDELPPFQVVNRLQSEIRRDIAGAATALPVASQVSERTALNRSPEEFLKPSFPADARTLSLLAGLVPSDGALARERLSVAALHGWLASPESAESHFFAAYAAMDLQRRPYALSLLANAKDPASSTLRELLNGNLTDARQSVTSVQDALQRLMLQFKVQDIATAYGRKKPPDMTTAQQLFGKSRRDWDSLVARRFTDYDSWAPTDPSMVKQLLDTLAPIQVLGLENLVRNSAVVGEDVDLQTLLTIANLRHLRQALKVMLPEDCCAPAGHAGRWSMYWMLEGVAEADIEKELERLNSQQALPAQAYELTEKIAPFLDGHPDFEFTRSRVLRAMAGRASNDDSQIYVRRYQESERIAAYWSLGQTPNSRAAVFRGIPYFVLLEAFSHDFPRRYYWPPVTGSRKSATSTGGCEALLYTVTNTEPVNPCRAETPAAAKAQLQAQLTGRFHGHPEITALLAHDPSLPAKPDRAADIARFRAAIDADPESWPNYDSLGKLLVHREGAYAEAQRVYLRYPGFKSQRGQNAVALSNWAYEAGSELYWVGQFELARPLYKIAADLDTGSAASLTSAARLAQLEGDYATAARIFLARATRYDDAFAFRDYLSLLNVMGYGKDARAGFLQIADSSSNPQAWLAELSGQRLAGTTYEQMKSWVLSDDIRSAHYREIRFAPIFAMWWMTADRTPGVDFPKLMQQVERDTPRTIGSHNQVVQPDSRVEGGMIAVFPTRFRFNRAPKLPEGTAIKSEHVMLAEALTRLHAGQYPAAVESFTAMADRYPIDNGRLKAALPYFALAAARTGDKLGLRKEIESVVDDPDGDFDVWLARAFFAAVERNADQAYDALKHAFDVRPHTVDRPIMTEYQFAEACEIALKETRDARFEAMLLDWARRHQRIQPTQAWAYAIEAQYSKAPAEAKRALAMTLYLDPSSPRIAKVDSSRRALAEAWLRTNNPFLVREKSPPKRVTFNPETFSAPPAS